MGLIEQLRARNDANGLAKRLYTLATDLRDAAAPHLKRIIAQLPEYDLHDEDHSVAVIRNMEDLLADKLPMLSSYELFLLSTAAYIHDIGMALPDAEFRLLQLTEGTEALGAQLGPLAIHNDLKAPWKLAEAVHFISSNAAEVYGSFISVTEWPFACHQEEPYRRDLAQRLVAYQAFRNGYAIEMKRILKRQDAEGYRRLSDHIRYDFIRRTHHGRADTFAGNLREMFSHQLGGAWGEALAVDLGKVCRAHGDDPACVLALSSRATYLGGETTNLAFVAALLRIADVMHYTYDRAPRSLFAEKMFRSLTSFKHWAVKNQGVNVSVDPTGDHGVRQITYHAFCRDPEYYYLLHSYMDDVDKELALFMRCVRDWRRSLGPDLIAERYDLDIADKVSRDNVRPDESVFTPKPGLSFTLDQRRVLDLLTGVGLYKEKYACVRELYQNALDACRCMLASKATRGDCARGEIEFGIGQDQTLQGETWYLYCRDNGIGMTQDIVEKHLLKVGNSYYVSPQFQRASVAWRDSFTPTSQFGIGILSSFIIGRRIEIASTAMATDGGQGTSIRFSIGGLHEQFYYMTPDPIDLERVGPHGTLVKVFLKDDEVKQLSNKRPSNIPLMIHAQGSGAYGHIHKEQMAEWQCNLAKRISDYVAVAHDRIDIQVRFDDDTVLPLPDRILPFGLGTEGLTLEDLAAIEESEIQTGTGRKRASIRDLAARLRTIPLRVSCEGVEFRGLLNLPNAGFPESDPSALDAVPMLRSGGILVDGIATGSESLYGKRLLHGLSSVGVINFTGATRPQLSVDRTKITEWPAETDQIMRGLLSKLLVQLRVAVCDHVSAEHLDEDSPEVRLIWEHIFRKFSFCTGDLIAAWATEHGQIPLRDLEALTGHSSTVGEFVAQEVVVLHGMRFPALPATAKIMLLGKLVKATTVTVAGGVCTIRSSAFVPLDEYLDERRSRDADVVVRADEWTGECAEYDIYSPVWPVIPKWLFEAYDRRGHGDSELITERAKRVQHFGNSVAALAEQDPVTIHPTMGIYHLDETYWSQDEVQNRVYRFERAAANFWLSEINDWRAVRSGETRYVLAVYLAPRELTDDEKVTLEQYAVKEPGYVQGVGEGWSVLALGDRECNTLILAGQTGRQALVNTIPEHIWSKIRDTHWFLDGTPLKAYRADS